MQAILVFGWTGSSHKPLSEKSRQSSQNPFFEKLRFYYGLFQVKAIFYFMTQAGIISS